ncbi:efflux RND transporter permease subunit [Solimonas soli]|jgi:predicted RND superfamily exporter protein|uniref:efflux RND transporter permease subunit n=1 Tax=Solimonas soli TaxID=413479 RepID=UPI0004BB1848|nr:MMPL family transporter [Solimonas soli]
MAVAKNSIDDMPVIARVEDFDRRSGGFVERAVFNFRGVLIVLCAMATVFLGWRATMLTVNASFDKMTPQSHPYIRNYFENRDALGGLGNSVRIVVETSGDDIFDPDYLQTLQKISDTVFLIPGVDRPWMKSLWTPLVRWTEITEEGLSAGAVMPEDYNGSKASIDQLRANVYRAGLIGDLVANDLKSSTVFVPLLDHDPDTGAPFDYQRFAGELSKIRHDYGSDKVKIHVVGFAQLAGDLIDGLYKVMGFFAASVLIVLAVLYFYTRCVRSTLLVVAAALVAVLWLLGIIQLLGYALDPYSVLVPFLIFAIGASHGTQKMNGIMQDVARGTHRYVAARYTFRRLFLAGLAAILCNVVGFAVLMVIDIPVIRDLALMTSIGVTILVFVVLLLLPVLLSYVGVSPRAARRRLDIQRREALPGGEPLGQRLLLPFTERRWATLAVVLAAVVATVAFGISRNLKVGDLDKGAPELWPDSRYNRDVAYVNEHYGLSSDQYAVIVKTPPGGCEKFSTLVEMDRLAQTLRAVPGVQVVVSAADAIRSTTTALYEGSPKWLTINRRENVLLNARDYMVANSPDLTNRECAAAPLIAYLSDHRADTLERVTDTVIAFAKQHDTDDLHFLPAAGSAGIQAITNIVVHDSNRTMLIFLYTATSLLCLLAFRSWRAVIVAIVPLVITSVICEALMVELNIGMKVATLPVIALGVGVGVDYALYLLSIQLQVQRSGGSLREAYARALGFTGRVVLLIGFTMAAGVVTWAWSPIKFQANMGLLLTFMFLWNIAGALVMIPALSYFLLRDEGRERHAAAVPA